MKTKPCKAALHWKFPADEKPPQGKKILCLHKGDVYVAQRYGEYYFSLPFYDGNFSRYFVPDMWSDIELPGGLTGRTLIEINGKRITIDELEKEEPEAFKALVNSQKEIFDQYKGKRGNIGAV